MDTPTTVVLGATVGTALLRKRFGAAGVVVFTAGALIPDLDQPFLEGTLAYIRGHRAATHSLVGATVGALLLAGAARLLRSRIRLRSLYLIALGGFLLGIGTDLLTWWGTQVLWPFSRARIGVGVIFIIDFWISGFVLAPFLVWGAFAIAKRPFPDLAFRVSVGVVVAWLVLCAGCRLVALEALGDLCEREGGTPVDAFPQPFSPLRWSLVADEGDAFRLRFVDLHHGREVLEERVFPKGGGATAELTDETEEGRTLLWFYRLPVREVRALADGRTEVVYRDLAYEMRPDLGRDPPFRFRFVLDGERVVERGWVNPR